MKHSLQMIAYRSLYSIAYATSLMPMTFLYSLASIAFFFTYHVIGYRREVAIQNVARSFPEIRYGEVRCIVEKFYRCFLGYFAEIIKGISAPPMVLEQQIVFENLELIDRHVHAGRNVIACLGHCGNWEMLNFMPYKLNHDMYAVYKPLRSVVMNRLMLKLRSRFGMNLIPDKAVIRHMLYRKSKPAVYLFLADQCPHNQDDRYKFELMHQETYVFSGMEKLARISGAAVVYLHIAMLPLKGSYKVTCMPVCSDVGTMEEGAITERYVELLTENIKDEPYGWLWTHKRWKR